MNRSSRRGGWSHQGIRGPRQSLRRSLPYEWGLPYNLSRLNPLMSQLKNWGRQEEEMSALSIALGAIEKLSPARIANAHCDIPCGIYDPHQAQIAAHTVVRMVNLI